MIMNPNRPSGGHELLHRGQRFLGKPERSSKGSDSSCNFKSTVKQGIKVHPIMKKQRKLE